VEFITGVTDDVTVVEDDRLFAPSGLGLYELGVWELGDELVTTVGGLIAAVVDAQTVSVRSDNQETVVTSDGVGVNIYG
jgi:hypothetical protein